MEPVGQQVPSKHTPAQQVPSQRELPAGQQRLLDWARQTAMLVQHTLPHVVVPAGQLHTGCIERSAKQELLCEDNEQKKSENLRPHLIVFKRFPNREKRMT